jgi:hypothetical protein
MTFPKPGGGKNTATDKADSRGPIAVIQIPAFTVIDADLGQQGVGSAARSFFDDPAVGVDPG